MEITRKSSTESAALQSIQPIESTKSDIEIQLTSNSSDQIKIPEKQQIENVPPPQIIIPSNLRETHIFTPNKSSNPISREVSIDKNDVVVVVAASTTDDEFSEFSEFQSSSEIKIDKNVITKEYRDVEYDPDKPKISKSISPTILQPTKIDSGSITINWPEPGRLSKSYNVDSDRFETFTTSVVEVKKPIESDFEFTEFQGTNTVKYEPDDDEFTNFQGGLKINSSKFSKPILGTSPTPPEIIKDEFDDEFTDFQSVTPAPAPAQVQNGFKENSILPPSINPSPPKTLVPNILVPENKKIMTIEPILAPSKINWPDPGVDMDEIARIEAAFSHKTIPDVKPVQKSATDDDWSDFVSVKNPIPKIQNPIEIKPIVTTNPPKEDDDDWSDFVSSTPNQWNNSSQLQSGPNFSSWNMPPPQFNSWNNTNLFQTPINQQTQQPQTGGYLANLNNGFNYGVNNQTSKKTNLNQKSSPSISILPDLGFAAPKTIMNIPKGNFNKK